MQKGLLRSELRAPKACEQCAQRKVKCDLSLPECSSCLSRDLHCTFSRRRKPGPPKGYKRNHAAHASSRLTPSSLHPLFAYNTPQHCFHDGGQDQWLDTLGSEIFDNDLTCLYPEQDDCVSGSVNREPMLPQPPSTISGQQMPKDFINIDLRLYGPAIDIQNQLVLGYLSWSQQLFPLFPMFKKSTLDKLLMTNRESVILDIVCAISARFSKAQNFADQSLADAGEYFASQAKSRSITNIATLFHEPSLEDIKGSLLLAIYDVLCRPETKALTRMDDTIRLAFKFGLDKIDSGNGTSVFELSKEEREDGRRLWWSICELDGFSSWRASRASFIDPRKATTLLPSTPFQNLTIHNSIAETPRKFPSDISQMWKEVSGCRSLSKSTQHIYLITVAFSRQVLTRLCMLRFGNKDIQHELLVLEDYIASYRLAFPNELQENNLSLFTIDVCPHTLRFNAEILLIIHMTTISLCVSKCINSGESPSSPETWNAKDWHRCLTAAFSIVDIIKDLPPKFLLTMSPTISGIFWLAGVCIGLQLAIDIELSKQEYLLARFNLTCLALNKISELWDISKEFYDSLQKLKCTIHTIKTVTDVWYILKDWISSSININSVPENGLSCYFTFPESWNIKQTAISSSSAELDDSPGSVSHRWQDLSSVGLDSAENIQYSFNCY